MSHILHKNIVCREAQMIVLNFTMVVGSTGAVGAIVGKGISGIVRNATGKYTITLDDKYRDFLQANFSFRGTTAAGVMAVQVDDVAPTTALRASKTILIQCLSAADADVDPAAGSILVGLLFIKQTSV